MKKIILILAMVGLFIGASAEEVNSEHANKRNFTLTEEEVVHYDIKEVNQTEPRVKKTDKRPIRKKVEMKLKNERIN